MAKLRDLAERHHLVRAVEFGAAGIVGFLAAEAIIVAGLYAVYGNLQLPGGISSSPSLLAIDVVAFLVGVTVGFFVNERTTVKTAPIRERVGKNGLLRRLAKYQGVYILGNAITIGTQIALLAWFALSPALGVMAGAVVAYPVSYLISMRFVWEV